MHDEQKLLTNLKKRKRGSLEKVIDLYTPYVSVVVYNTVGAVLSKEDIEEVVSDVFVSLWQNAENLDIKKGCIRTYIGAAARNRAKNKLRKIFLCSEINENVTDSFNDPNAEFEVKEEREILINLIKSLGEPDSEIFFRYYYYEERISKISKVTGIAVGTIKTKLARGRGKLKKALIQKEVWQ